MAHLACLAYSSVLIQLPARGIQVKQTSTAQKVSFIIAIISYLAAIGCVVGVFYYESELGGDHPVVASFGAAVVFFIGVGIVLHVIGRVNLPNLSMKFSNEQQDRSDD